MRTLEGRWEIIPSERNKTWKVPETYTVSLRSDPTKKLTIPKDYPYDRYTLVRDLPDDIPCQVHDYSFDSKGSGHRWDDGRKMTLLEADTLLLERMEESYNEETRNNAEFYYRAVRKVGWAIWFRESVLIWLFRR